MAFNPTTSFRFSCYKTLKRSMGKLDAVVECNELAVRRFLSEANTSSDPKSYVQSMSNKYGVKVDHVDTETLRVRVRHLYLLSAYQQAEEFLEQFREEHPQSGSWTYNPKLALLDNVLRNIGPNYTATCTAVGTLEIRILDYYRQVRNRFMHTELGEERLEKRLERVASELHEATREHEDFSKLSAPNSYHHISFDDFVLFTRTVKRTAGALCRAGRPTDDDIVQMVETLAKQEPPKVNLKSMKWLKQNSGRQRNALANALLQHFSLKREEAEPIIGKIIMGPLA